MKMSIVACVALGTCATLATAQEEEGDGTAKVAAPHRIAVFTAEPDNVARRGTAALTRRNRQRPDEFRPGTGASGFTLGRQYDFEYLTRPDVAGYPAQAGPGAAVQYYNDGTRNVSSGASWTVDAVPGDWSNRAWGISVGADFGAFSLRAAHQNLNAGQFRVYDLTGHSTEAKNSIVAANYRLGWGTAYAAYSMNRGWGSSPLYNPDNPYGAGVAGTSSTDSRDALVGVAVPVTGSTTLLASYIRKNDRDPANRDANQIAVGASYVLSRKTDFYAALSHTVNTNGAGILIDGAARPSGSNAINIGMRHSF